MFKTKNAFVGLSLILALFIGSSAHALVPEAAPAAVKVLFDFVGFGASANQFAQNDGIDRGYSSYAVLSGAAWPLEAAAAISGVAVFFASHLSPDGPSARRSAGISLIFGISALALNAASLERLNGFNSTTTALPSADSVLKMKNANIVALSANAASVLIGLAILTFGNS